jgi:hypothetical protein
LYRATETARPDASLAAVFASACVAATAGSAQSGPLALERGCAAEARIIRCVTRTRTAKALANPNQPHSALVRELERYIEAHNPDATDVNVLSATDTGQADKTHKPVRHWYHVSYQAQD